jgi:Flp pilus assembly protein TadG
MRRREEGAVAVIVAIVLLVFVAAVAIAVDVGGLMLHRRGLVNSSDAAALSAARTCARGGFDDHGTTEDAADTAAMANSLITDAEARPMTNIMASLSTTCGETSGHVTVGYTSQQALFFAPAIGFNSESPVHTEATASWGLGSNNPVPLVVSGQLASSCPQPPPAGTNTVGQAPCGRWYDNDDLNNGNFGFLSLKPEGWDVPADDNCSGATGGSSEIGDWVSGQEPVSVSLNWTEPTYVCNIGGFKGQSHPWDELETLARTGEVRDFPITWEGPGSPGFGAPPQGSLPTGGKIEKYDVIGFAALRILDVLSTRDAGPTTTTTQQPFTDYTYTNLGITFGTPLPSGAVVTYTWLGKKSNGNPTGGTCGPFTTNTAFAPGLPPHTWQSLGGNGGGCPGNNEVLNLGQPSSVSITVPVTTTTPGPCGPVPNDSSAKCVITQWLGSTLTDDYPTDDLDNIRVVRLCDLAEGTCLDQ